MRNKEHYILATADPPASDVGTAHPDDNDKSKKRKRTDRAMEEAIRRAVALRHGARAIPGVPIVYVKRSVMILEPMSAPSESVRDGVERSKFKTGVEVANAITGKRKREDEEGGEQKKVRGLKKAKGPNPLSVKKPKKRAKEDPAMQGKKLKKEKEEKKQQGGGGGGGESNEGGAQNGEASAVKKRKRRHKSAKEGGSTANGEASAPAAASGAE